MKKLTYGGVILVLLGGLVIGAWAPELIFAQTLRAKLDFFLTFSGPDFDQARFLGDGTGTRESRTEKSGESAGGKGCRTGKLDHFLTFS